MASENGTGPQEYDLLIIVDSTMSMGDFLTSLTDSIPQITSLSALTGCFKRIGIVAYIDYDQEAFDKVIQWSGWLHTDLLEPDIDLTSFARGLSATGGGDWEEAVKTALAKAYVEMRGDATTLILLYTDAPPHTHANGNVKDLSDNFGLEFKALTKTKRFGDSGVHFADWVEATKMLAHKHPESTKKAQVFSIFAPGDRPRDYSYYMYLSTVTGGAFTQLTSSTPASITQTTVAILLAWMQSEKADPNAKSVSFPAELRRFANIKNIKSLSSEEDPAAIHFFPISKKDMKLVPMSEREKRPAMTKAALTSDRLRSNLPKRKIPLGDFSKRYNVDEVYRKVATKQIKCIIERDVTTMATNPIFGSLWRVVCNDRKNEERDKLLAAFSLAIEKLRDEGEKSKMKDWLENSYDYTAEVLHLIESVPEEKRYPFVFLDPTLSFAPLLTSDEDGDDITKLSRDELLEIGRSCDYKILRRLGKCLTQLTFVSKLEDMPEHIAATKQEELQKIPLALASNEYGGRFWQILLHLIVPGTMLGARPAALVAALAMRMQVRPLLPSAEKELLKWRSRWNNLEVPETFNINCLSLLLEADRLYRETHNHDNYGHDSLLLEEDRQLFDKLVAYKMLEMNLDTTLTVRLGWTPQKTAVPIGPIIECQECKIFRSVTMMGKKRRCGLCVAEDYGSDNIKRARLVSRADEDQGIWVECSNPSCRCQYCIYNPKELKIRPKCFYCRENAAEEWDHKTKAPFVECHKCLNRVIYPDEYRPDDFNAAQFECYACSAGKKTVVDVETSATEMNKENGVRWLLRKFGKQAPFSGRSLFKTISEVGSDDFKKIEIFPEVSQKLSARGKIIQNQGDVIDQLKSWVMHRKTEQGTCDLCFSSQKKKDLLPACGRRGCQQFIDRSCLENWYGINGRGKIINTAALYCPFCRRAPTAKTLAAYGMGIHAVAELAMAVKKKGTWIYAWCFDCNYARPFMERVCAQGPAPELRNWYCDICRAKKGKLPDSVKPCPKCKVATQRISGCDHVQCPNCETHWCFFCGREQLESEIYRHMGRVHGGYYGGFEENFEDDNEGVDLYAEDY